MVGSEPTPDRRSGSPARCYQQVQLSTVSSSNVRLEDAALAQPDPSLPVRLRALERVLTIADTLIGMPPLPLAEIAARSGLSHTACHRWLQAMVRTRLAVREVGGYQLGPRWTAWAAREATANSVRTIAVPLLHRLARATGLTTMLARRMETCWVALQVAYPPAALTEGIGFGQTGPLFAGACGRILLAWLEGWEREAVWARMGSTPLTARTPSRKQLMKDVDRVRSQGWAATAGERRGGAFSLAVPVVRVEGRKAVVSYALAAGGMGAAWPPQTKVEQLARLLAAGAELSRSLGYRGPYPPP